jgi:hypothetical protein
MTDRRRPGDHGIPAERFNALAAGAPSRVSGTVDRRREIQAELALQHRRASDLCTPTCIHRQDADALANHSTL